MEPPHDKRFTLLQATRFFPSSLSPHFVRLPLPVVAGKRSPAITKEALLGMKADLAPAAASFAVAGLSVVCFACTSSSLLIGLDVVEQELHKGLAEGGFYGASSGFDGAPSGRPRCTSLSRAVF